VYINARIYKRTDIETMRAFYTDSNDKMRTFYVKVDNIQVSNDKVPYAPISAETGSELLDNIMKYYRFNNIHRDKLQIWTKSLYNTGGIRLDILDKIPDGYEFIYVRGVATHTF
jgi:hypothetical protein